MWHVWERRVYRFFVGNPEGKNHWENQGIDGRMRSEWILGREIDWGVQSGSGWLRWWAVVNTVMNLWVLAPRSYLVMLKLYIHR
jgi:hypothetical protein